MRHFSSYFVLHFCSFTWICYFDIIVLENLMQSACSPLCTHFRKDSCYFCSLVFLFVCCYIVNPSSYTVVQTVVIFVPLLLFLSISFCLLLLLLMDKLSTFIAYRCTLILIHSGADRSGCSSVSLRFKFLFYNFQKYNTFCDFARITQ